MAGEELHDKLKVLMMSGGKKKEQSRKNIQLQYIDIIKLVVHIVTSFFSLNTEKIKFRRNNQCYKCFTTELC